MECRGVSKTYVRRTLWQANRRLSRKIRMVACHLHLAQAFGGDNRLTAAVRRSKCPTPNWNRQCRL